MIDTSIIRNGLQVQKFPVYQTDIPYIQQIMYVMYHSKEPLDKFPHLNMTIPVTIVDKGLLQ
ncbi:hypothetical protein [Ornithinibacillus halophilus]|uniref:Uncharacterized protein n=1 Tax=Ornithinibacillus halophilus TaxID=930117 RepID=A0A1M5I4Z2_9BACI|nr:hypothetical protein [Ornithinibacillus halophilus]SHG23396.1 hypothetical protein SAMN05216225_102160 [Ornithinibacillus halophilus]